ncbi:hypothetical protein HPC49_02795 [Pyxidicoccus fallax]|uniref:Uncharacterized protein n=1 Tax=Pyxidicoccus fallax TaxID=394095 RepID=A0A848L497_9BACT|nr:hypothetical protein [Pyxidicoccus fallax]NMO13277.1 hypothetical protein [Pyxidicoccus fallax]NPC77183.1 hypothetical protein [Pyxidicoccus fallax]
MSTWNAIYFRGELPPGLRPEVEGTCTVRRVSGWMELALPGVVDGEAATVALSRQVSGQVVWVLVQTTASTVSVMHCENGQVQRRIEFADGVWQRVEGQPQPWEAWLFSDEELEAAKDVSDAENDSELEAAFARKTLKAGDTLPWPREWESFFHAIDVSQADWEAARAAPPLASVEGRKTSGLTVFTRVALLAGVGCAVGAFLTHDSVRAVLASLAAPLLFLAFGAAFVRGMRMGRWFL